MQNLNNENPPSTALVADSGPFGSSPDLSKLFEALAKAQGEMRPAVLDCVNPHFRSKYASLTSCQETFKYAFKTHGLSVIQQVFSDEDGYFLRTVLGHASGQWISNEFKLLVEKSNMQGLGSALTYARRYSLSCLVGIASEEDDDGNQAAAPSAAPKSPPASQPKPKPETSPAKPKVPNPAGALPEFPQGQAKEIAVAKIRRLFAIADEGQWTQVQMKDYMNARWGIQSTKELTQEQYDQLIGTMQAMLYELAIADLKKSK